MQQSLGTNNKATSIPPAILPPPSLFHGFYAEQATIIASFLMDQAVYRSQELQTTGFFQAILLIQVASNSPRSHAKDFQFFYLKSFLSRRLEGVQCYITEVFAPSVCCGPSSLRQRHKQGAAAIINKCLMPSRHQTISSKLQ